MRKHHLKEKTPRLWLVAAVSCLFMAAVLLMSGINQDTVSPAVQASVLHAEYPAR